MFLQLIRSAVTVLLARRVTVTRRILRARVRRIVVSARVRRILVRARVRRILVRAIVRVMRTVMGAVVAVTVMAVTVVTIIPIIITVTITIVLVRSVVAIKFTVVLVLIFLVLLLLRGIDIFVPVAPVRVLRSLSCLVLDAIGPARGGEVSNHVLGRQSMVVHRDLVELAHEKGAGLAPRANMQRLPGIRNTVCSVRRRCQSPVHVEIEMLIVVGSNKVVPVLKAHRAARAGRHPLADTAACAPCTPAITALNEENQKPTGSVHAFVQGGDNWLVLVSGPSVCARPSFNCPFWRVQGRSILDLRLRFVLCIKVSGYLSVTQASNSTRPTPTNSLGADTMVMVTR
mmetsp:Transcript_18287/g.42983  ORF Transcript_18287/g.42983 Transcript_18287/m.42983 type:complete len:344 (-) Transcript_18287:553-1584(-)